MHPSKNTATECPNPGCVCDRRLEAHRDDIVLSMIAIGYVKSDEGKSLSQKISLDIHTLCNSP